MNAHRSWKMQTNTFTSSAISTLISTSLANYRNQRNFFYKRSILVFNSILSEWTSSIFLILFCPIICLLSLSRSFIRIPTINWMVIQCRWRVLLLMFSRPSFGRNKFDLSWCLIKNWNSKLVSAFILIQSCQYQMSRSSSPKFLRPTSMRN